jgi:TolB-like protein/AraC-like DNA-binding protein/Tfp pilus assembly protein PilF
MSNSINQTDKATLEKLNQIIDSNLNNSSFTPLDICNELGQSRSQLFRLIKEHHQLSISLYIRQRKLLKAKELLDNSDLKISEITYRVGIDSPQSFSKYFTDAYGVSPTEYRKNKPPFVEQEDLPFVSINQIVNKPKSAIFLKNWLYLVIPILLFVVFGIYFWQKNKTKTSSSFESQSSENSIAILPFKNLGNNNNSYFSEGVMEQIHSTLASLNNLKVISTTSTNKYANTQKNSQQIGKDLHVKYILGGSVLQLDKQVRITVELVETEDDRVVWSKTFEGDTKNIFGYMSTIAKEITKVLNQKLSTVQNNKFEKMPTQSLEAYNEFLQGQQLLKLRNVAKMEASVVKFDKAIELDPNFADAYAQKAVAYFVMGNNQLTNAESYYKIAERNALTAIKLDAENGKAYAVLAHNYGYHNKWEQAITTFNIALKFSPNDAQINYWYSLTIRSIGMMEEAIKYSTKAIALDPLAPNVYGGHIINYCYAGKLDMAEKAIKDGELYFKDAYLFHYAVGFYYVALKDYKNALKSFTKSLELDKEDLYTKAVVIYCKAKLGDTVAVKTFVQSLPNIPQSQRYLALAYAGMENKEQCLKHLELAAAINDSPLYIKVSPLFSFLHREPRFNAILQKLGLENVVVELD